MAKASTPGPTNRPVIVLEHADDFVELAIDADGFADGVFVGEQRFADGRAKARRPGGRVPDRKR